MADQSTLPLGVVGVVDGTREEAKPKPREDVDFFNLMAKKLGAPEGWRWMNLETIGDHKEKRRTHQFNVMTGYVHNGARFQTGKRAGQLKPKSAVPGSERTFHFTMQDLDDLQREWERETGKCSKCSGTGEQFAAWSRADGSRYTKCVRCFGTGKSHPPAVTP